MSVRPLLVLLILLVLLHCRHRHVVPRRQRHVLGRLLRELVDVDIGVRAWRSSLSAAAIVIDGRIRAEASG